MSFSFFLLPPLFSVENICQNSSEGISVPLRKDGNGVSGGNSIVCRNSQGIIQKSWFLDRYESEEVFHLKYTLENDPGNYSQHLHTVLERLNRFDPSRKTYYAKLLNDFEIHHLCLNNVELTPVPDSYHFVVPKNCEVIQTAVQTINPHTGERIYVIRKDIWNILSELDRATLILHEILYSELLEYGHQNSIAARAFTSELFSNQLEQKNLKEYLRFLKDNEIAYLYSGLPLELGTLWTYHPLGEIHSAFVKYHLLSSSEAPKFYERTIQGRQIKLRAQEEIFFYPDGSLEAAHLYGDLKPHYDFQIELKGLKFTVTPFVLTKFHSQYKIASFTGRLDTETPLQIQGKHIPVADGYFEFYPSEKLKSFFLKEAVYLQTKTGVSKLFPAHTKIQLTESGTIQEDNR